jgi:hypothetical protein
MRQLGIVRLVFPLKNQALWSLLSNPPQQNKILKPLHKPWGKLFPRYAWNRLCLFLYWMCRSSLRDGIPKVEWLHHSSRSECEAVLVGAGIRLQLSKPQLSGGIPQQKIVLLNPHRCIRLCLKALSTPLPYPLSQQWPWIYHLQLIRCGILSLDVQPKWRWVAHLRVSKLWEECFCGQCKQQRDSFQ